MRAAPLLPLAGVLLASACAPAVPPAVAFDPAWLRFSGERALAHETDFVTRFPHRSSGRPNNLAAAEWLRDTLASHGLDCTLDTWEFVNYSRPTELHNTVCVLRGQADEEIVLTAHHDQAPTTVFGADNDGSGVAILITLAELLSHEETPQRTVVFLFADAEEFGNAGTLRYLETHPDRGRIVAALSLDNLGKKYYAGTEMDPRGRFRGYGQLWLQLAAQEAARAAGIPVPKMRSVAEQVLEQAVPVAFMDEGGFVAHDIPAFGLTGSCPAECQPLHDRTYHTPEDTLEHQSAASLETAGRVTEATLRQSLAMDDLPDTPGPYLYFAGSRAVLRGLPLAGSLLLLPAAFLAGAVLIDRGAWRRKLAAWGRALPHFLGLWLPLLASVVLLYGFVQVGLLDRFYAYFATSKDPAWTSPRWPAVVLYVSGLIAALAVGRRLAAVPIRRGQGEAFPARKSLAMLVVGLASLFVFATNPFSLVFLAPVLSWYRIGGRRGAGYALDLLFFLLGGLLVYVLLYFFGRLLHIGPYVLWYLMMMFAIPMISFAGATAVTGVIAAGLSLIIRPPDGRRSVPAA